MRQRKVQLLDHVIVHVDRSPARTCFRFRCCCCFFLLFYKHVFVIYQSNRNFNIHPNPSENSIIALNILKLLKPHTEWTDHDMDISRSGTM